MRDEVRQTLLDAATVVAEGRPLAGAGERARTFLEYLGGTAAADEKDGDLAALLRVAARLDRLFELPVPDAPGLYCFGAQASAAAFGGRPQAAGSVSGIGDNRAAAFRACVAEAVEFISQFEYDGDDRAVALQPAESLPEAFLGDLGTICGTDDDDAGSWVVARALPQQCEHRVPAGLVWRRRDRSVKLDLAPGLGVAAGRNADAALRHALCEWIERDAVALWWRGGRRGRAFAQETLAKAGVAARLAAWRGDRMSARRTWFLDLTTEIGVPVAGAFSVDGVGAGFAYGFAARPRVADALAAALQELMQIELADRLVDAKRRESGDGALNDTDRLHLRRRAEVRHDLPLLQPVAVTTEEFTETEPSAALEHQGFHALAVDLSRRDLAVNVMRVLVPGLQPDPGRIMTARLARQREVGAFDGTSGELPPLY
jgi:thiazole/oxazole-forming peptide maturase SagD family component